jgi:hypothetical protein
MSVPNSESDRWAGVVIFAAVMMFLVGAGHVITGITALSEPESLARPLLLDIAAWGWVHVLGGVVIIFAGMALYSGATWARAVGIVLVSASAIGAFASLSGNPWSVIVIGIDLLVLWALMAHGAALRLPERGGS